MCLDEVPDILESSNVIEWWKEARKMNYDDTKNQCEEIMATNFSAVSQQTDFVNLELNDVKHYITNICRHTVGSDSVLNQAMRWVNYKEERIMHLEDILKSVQLTQCSSEGLSAVTKTYESLFEKVPIVYRLLNIALAGATKSNTVVVVGGEVRDEVSRTCWRVDHSDQIVPLCDIPDNDLTERFSVCTIPQGFVITGGLDEYLCMMFTAATKSWVRLQDLIESRRAHGSICVRNVLYILGGFLGDAIDDELSTSDGETVSDEASASVHSMKMEIGSWQHEPDMPLAVRCPNVASIDNTVYLLDALDSMKLLQMDDDKIWSERAPMPQRTNHWSEHDISQGSSVCGWRR